MNTWKRLVETFCEVDDFCQAFVPPWEAYLLGTGSAPHGPQPGLVTSDIITILLMRHSSRCQYLKRFDQGVMGNVLRQYFPGMPCYQRCVTLPKSVFMPLLCLLLSRLGQKTGIYYIDSTALAVCHHRRISRHQTCAGQNLKGLVLRLQVASGVQSTQPECGAQTPTW